MYLALQINPKHVPSLAIKGECLISKKLYEKALSILESVLQIDAHDVYTLSLKGKCLIMMQNYQKPIECFDEALKFDKNHCNTLQLKSIIKLNNSLANAYYQLKNSIMLQYMQIWLQKQNLKILIACLLKGLIIIKDRGVLKTYWKILRGYQILINGNIYLIKSFSLHLLQRYYQALRS